MTYETKAVANYFIDLGISNHIDLSPMKLQKLVYFAHGWYLAIHNERLIDENIAAWSFGPVISTIYHEFKHFGNDAIDTHAVNMVFNRKMHNDYVTTIPIINRLDIRTASLLNKVWEIYSDYSAVQLSNATHACGTPWYHTWVGTGVSAGTTINDEEIKHFFIEISAKNRPTNIERK